MQDRLWSYPEIKFIKVHSREYSNEELAQHLNEKFHNNQTVRTAIDVIKQRNKKNIFDY